MNRTLLFGISIFLVLVGISLLGGEGQAIAGHGCHGCGGAYSCYGNYAYRDCHGCWGRSYVYRSLTVSRRCHGFSGCYGCGGAYSCYGRSAQRDCHGCWGRSYLFHSPVVSRRCHGCFGCGGCSGNIQCHGEYTVIERNAPTEVPAEREQPTPAASDSDEDETTKINLFVPSDATVFANGRSTKSTGSQRRYVSKGLLHGHKYLFEFRVEVNRNGQTLTRHKTITVSANEVHDVSFDFDATHVAVVSDR